MNEVAISTLINDFYKEVIDTPNIDDFTKNYEYNSEGESLVNEKTGKSFTCCRRSCPIYAESTIEERCYTCFSLTASGIKASQDDCSDIIIKDKTGVLITNEMTEHFDSKLSANTIAKHVAVYEERSTSILIRFNNVNIFRYFLGEDFETIVDFTVFEEFKDDIYDEFTSEDLCKFLFRRIKHD